MDLEALYADHVQAKAAKATATHIAQSVDGWCFDSTWTNRLEFAGTRTSIGNGLRLAAKRTTREMVVYRAVSKDFPLLDAVFSATTKDPSWLRDERYAHLTVYEIVVPVGTRVVDIDADWGGKYYPHQREVVLLPGELGKCAIKLAE